MTVAAGTVILNISYEGLLVMVFSIIITIIINYEKVASSNKHTQYFQTRVLKPYPIYV